MFLVYIVFTLNALINNILFNNKSPQINGEAFCWCAGRESNPHALRHSILSAACIPIPSPALEFIFTSMSKL